MSHGQQYNVAYPKEVEGKTFWVPVGRAFALSEGKVKVLLDAIPLNFTGELVLFPAPKGGK